MQMSNKSPGQGSLAIFFREGVVVEGRPQNHVLDHLGPPSHPKKLVLGAGAARLRRWTAFCTVTCACNGHQ